MIRVTRNTARWIQLAGLVIAILGLAGFWLGRDVARSSLGSDQRDVLGIDDDAFFASFVVAGRDVFYEPGTRTPVLDEDGEIDYYEYEGRKTVDGTNTDTILYVSIIENAITMVAIPRDLFVGDGVDRINGVFARHGPDGLRQQVSDLLGVPVDYYAIINLDIFRDVVDALGGVEVNVPTRMYYEDRAGGLTIDIHPGLQVLDGETASEFVRYRQFQRGDIDRLDNVKQLAYAMLARLKQLNVRAVARIPELVDTVMRDVETNVSPALVRQLIPRIGRLEIRETATLPTEEVERPVDEGESVAIGLEVDTARLRPFLAATFGGSAGAPVAEAPEAGLRIVNRSGLVGLGEVYRDRLVGLGVPRERIDLREGSLDPTPTRLVTTLSTLTEADYYTSLLGVGIQQVDRLVGPAAFELVLGEDARRRAPEAIAARVDPQR